ncbi:MAG: hypothetical protein L0338_39685 [Acidobacteria bacterium]|nr:hypothetical protein [Acidobacteriota bacterium]
MATLLEAHDLARTLLGERQSPPEVFTDVFLLPLSKEVYREIQRRLARNGFPRLKDYAQFNLTAGVLSITDGAAGYPTTVIQPMRLWERDQASALFADFVQMEEADPELIPRATVTALVHWEWKNDSLNFVGATGNRTIRMLFAKYLVDLAAVGDTLAIKDVVGALAAGTAAAAARSRGSTLAPDMDTLFTDYVQKLIDRDFGRLTSPIPEAG